MCNKFSIGKLDTSIYKFNIVKFVIYVAKFVIYVAFHISKIFRSIFAIYGVRFFVIMHNSTLLYF